MRFTFIVLSGVFASAATLFACGSGPDTPAGDAAPIGGVIRPDRFVTTVVEFKPGDCTGFGLAQMPTVVLGPPVGAGAFSGGLDVLSLGWKGELVLSFGDNAVVDGPGADFIVFENAFWVGGDPAHPTTELAEVSVSDDGVNWKAFPCTVADAGADFGTCAGWHPVYSAPGNGISPVDPETAGGDPYDLATLGVTHAKFVRIRDLASVECPTDAAKKPTTVGFDLDAIAIVNAKTP